MKQRCGIRPRPRSVIIRAGIFLLLGVIVNIAVAWGCAAWSPMVLSAPDEGFSKRLLSRQDKDWLTLIRWQPQPKADTVTVHPRVVRGRGFGLSYSEYLEEGETTSHYPRELVVSWVARPPFAVVLCAGWPSLSQFGGIELAPGAVATARHNALVLSTSTARNAVPRLLPLRPIWPGFAINMLFYAAILWLLLALPGALRRWRRIKRGLCPACAYPVGTSDVCTECGKLVKARIVEPAPS